MFTANSIFIMASKSDKLTSNYFETWIKEVFFLNVGPNFIKKGLRAQKVRSFC